MLLEGFFDKVYYRFWKVNEKDQAFANVFAIHGLGGHSLWFDKAGELFNKRNINLFSFDLPGFGQSKYTRGWISSYKIWIDTTREILKKFLVNFNVNAPVFVLGHSMGAMILILLAKNVKANGWIISVPGFEGHNKTWPFRTFVLPVLFKSIFKSEENIVLPFGPELLTKNKETQLKIKRDPLRVVNVSAKVFLEVYILTLMAKYSSFTREEPVLMLEAGQDQVCSNLAMDEYFEKIMTVDKCKKVYTNSYHDLFVEDELNQIVDDISNWTRDRIR